MACLDKQGIVPATKQDTTIEPVGVVHRIRAAAAEDACNRAGNGARVVHRVPVSCQGHTVCRAR